MSFSKQATNGHWIVGIILVLLAVACMIANLTIGGGFLSILVFFFSVWGGVEISRFLEHWLSRSSASDADEK